MTRDASATATTISPPEKQVTFSLAMGNVKLMHECSPINFRMGTARMKEDNETEEVGEKSEYMERSTADMKKISPDGLAVGRAYRPPGIATPRSSG